MALQHSTDRTPLDKAVKSYLENNCKIIPLTPAIKGQSRTGKQPISGATIKSPCRDIRSFRKLVGNRNCNIGVVTGEASGLVIIDVDPRNGGVKSMKELREKYGPLPAGPKVRTGGGGYHLWFRAPKHRCPKRQLAAGVDFLAEGSYAVAPPSQHSSGRRYKWIKGKRIGEIELPALPDTWFAFVGDRQKVQPLRSGSAGGSIPQGSRNATLMSEGGRLRQRGKNETEIREQLGGINQERCEPPLQTSEVDAIAKSAASYPAGGPNTPEALLQRFLEVGFESGRHLRYECDGQFWHYTGKVWEPIIDKLLEQKVLNFIRDRQAAPAGKPMPLVNELVTLMRVSLAAHDDLLHFKSSPPQVLNLLNGELVLSEKRDFHLRPHAAGSGLRTLLQVAYDSKATCPQYDRALTAIFAGAEKTAQLIRLWNEIVGYIIQPSRKIALILILYGTGANGKTKLVGTIRKLIGQDAVYDGNLGDLDKSRFAYGALSGKQLFIDDDVKAGAKLPDGILKKISEEKVLTGELKHRNAFNFVCRVAVALLTNHVPSLADVSVGMRRRLIVLPFNNRFQGKKCDPGLFERIWQSEMSGVLNRALKGWSDVQKRGRLLRAADSADALKHWLAEANPTEAFLNECTERDDRSRATLQQLYDKYVQWAKDSGYSRSLQKGTLKRNLEHLGFRLVRGNQGQTACGLKLR